MVQVAKLIPFENPDVLNIVRATYVCSNLIIVGVYLWMQSQMDKKKGRAARLRHTMMGSRQTVR